MGGAGLPTIPCFSFVLSKSLYYVMLPVFMLICSFSVHFNIKKNFFSYLNPPCCNLICNDGLHRNQNDVFPSRILGKWPRHRLTYVNLSCCKFWIHWMVVNTKFSICQILSCKFNFYCYPVNFKFTTWQYNHTVLFRLFHCFKSELITSIYLKNQMTKLRLSETMWLHL